jgi:tetratricopeptide (TPR) repeat protein
MSLLDEPGDLARTPLAAVLLEALGVGATGVLEVAHGGGTSRLWFREGRPVGAQVFTGFRPLGMMLLQAGRIDIEALSTSLVRMAETRRPQGEILVEMGAASAADVAAALAEQQAGYYGMLAGLDDGPFAFDRTTPVPEWTRESRLSPLATVADALERPRAAPLVASALQRVATTGARLARDPAEAAGPAPWSDAERALVARLERGATLDEFFLSSPVAPERARAILAALLLTGAAVPAVGAPEEPPGPAAPPPSRSDPVEARARRQRLVQQGLRNMGIGPFAARGAAEPPPPPEPEAGVAPVAGSTHGAAAGDAERQLREDLLAMGPRARAPDLFARLGIPETAGREEVKRAFLAIARQFHPDRFASPAFADLQDTVRDFFAAVNEAYEVLGDDRTRAAYVAERRGKAAAQAEAARLAHLKAEACLRTRDFARARAFLESAVRAEPRAEYQASLAFAWLADPAQRDPARARRLLAEATKDPRCDRAHYVAGLLARDEGDDAAAERCFRAAVKANPRNADAVRELRHVEARRGPRRG